LLCLEAFNEILAKMQLSRSKYVELIRAFAPSGNLFLLLTLSELRRQGLTYLAFYVLQKCIEKEISQSTLRCQTGLPNHEISRACKFLEKSGLVEITKSDEDARVRVVNTTEKGRLIHRRVLAAAAKQLKNGLPEDGHPRRISEATNFLRGATRVLLGQLQLTFFDVGLLEENSGHARHR
jgi:DNA-binding MarR family transcriptional regulator